MLRVRAEARPSRIHGLGLFAMEFVPEGTLVAGWSQDSDYSLTKEQWEGLPDGLRRFLDIFVWETKDGVIRGTSDAGRFTNHSSEPNLMWDPELDGTVASRDIWPDEELTEDYSQFDSAFQEYSSKLR